MHASITKSVRDRLRGSFLAGRLRIRSVAPDGRVEWRRVERVMRTPTMGRQMVEVSTEYGPLVVTADHGICIAPEPAARVSAGELRVGDPVLCVVNDRAVRRPIVATRRLPPRDWVYNLSVEGNRNFDSVVSRITKKNSPDKFYHFRPPEHEGRVGRYDRVFGQVWEDQELLLYLQRALDDWTLVPPNTDQIRTIDEVWLSYPGWRSGITWGAIIHALFAVMLNWIQDEFDYSIGGVSLSIEKSSKFQSALGDAKDMWDKAAEGKTKTELYILGLKQPRFGVGVRSAFGPYVRGTLGPRSFTM